MDWKKRKCLLTGESLSLFSDPKDIEPSQIVFLNGATAEAELGEVGLISLELHVECILYIW